MVEDSAVKVAASSGTEEKKVATQSRGIDLITGPDGELLGFSVSEAAQLYQTVDRIISSRRILALPLADRYALAGKVAAVPAEHGRLVEKLASSVATSISEAGSLNALYLLEICKELVPKFKEAIPEGRLEKAAELSPHSRAQAAVLLGEKPKEWELADKQGGGQVVMMLPQDHYEEDEGIVTEAGRAVGDATKFVGGAAFGGVGLITDTLGITDDAENELAETAEDAVDLVGDGVNAVVDTVGEGIDGTADDFAEKGVVGAVEDGMADAVDLVSDFVDNAMHGIAGGVRDALDWVSGEEAPQNYSTHKVAVVVGELFGEERSLGLRLENRVVTRFTKPEAQRLGWKLGDCIMGVNLVQVNTQDEMLAQIAQHKEALKTSGTPIRFLVERLGEKPSIASVKPGDLVRVRGRPARVQDIQGNDFIVQFQDDGSMARVPRSQ
eukprot:TRINITY_DN64586_c0_g1_i1.p1 TRINITY_DN64586_c0_g1~~TRINITY_DN64586_c0_g1_i1.p1  ORF type:complete len:440 (-),score=109.66 TRINITY_DN64586_c0_g1_i1:84-1403(-)